MRPLLVLLATGVFVAATAAFGDELARPVRDVTVIQDEHGAARILFNVDPLTGLTDIAVSKALLRFTTAGVAEGRRMTLVVHPITRPWLAGSVSWTSPWSNPGGDFDPELYARLELNLAEGSSTHVLDLTPLIKEIVEEGTPMQGFLLTVDPSEGTGLRVADLGRFQGFGTAAVEIRYRHVSPRLRRAG